MLYQNRPVDYKVWGVKQQSMYQMKICNIYDLQKCLGKLGLTLNRSLSRLHLTSGATIRDHVCMPMADTLNTCCETVVRLYYVVHQNIL